MMKYSKLKIEVYLPEEIIEIMRNELNAVGACKVGNYDMVTSYSLAPGTWRPLQGSNPYNGEIGEVCSGTEYKLEIRCDRDIAHSAIDVIKRVHLYDCPLINVIPLVNEDYGLE